MVPQNFNVFVGFLSEWHYLSPGVVSLSLYDTQGGEMAVWTTDNQFYCAPRSSRLRVIVKEESFQVKCRTSVIGLFFFISNAKKVPITTWCFNKKVWFRGTRIEGIKCISEPGPQEPYRDIFMKRIVYINLFSNEWFRCQ
jgi:hypothetical protein